MAGTWQPCVLLLLVVLTHLSTHCNCAGGELLQRHFSQLIAQAAQVYPRDIDHRCKHRQGVGGD